MPAVVGTLQIWRRSRECRLIILVMLAFITFYAMFPAHQGPRHRVQLVANMRIGGIPMLAERPAIAPPQRGTSRSTTSFRPAREGHLFHTTRAADVVWRCTTGNRRLRS